MSSPFPAFDDPYWKGRERAVLYAQPMPSGKGLRGGGPLPPSGSRIKSTLAKIVVETPRGEIHVVLMPKWLVVALVVAAALPAVALAFGAWYVGGKIGTLTTVIDMKPR